MTWWRYVQRHADGAANTRIAEAVGITPSSVGRWNKGSSPDPAQAANFARAYGRPVLEAFVAAGFLSAEEAKERPTAAPSLEELDDDDLLNEVRRRMGRSRNDVADQDQKIVKLGHRRPQYTGGLPQEDAADDVTSDTSHEQGGKLD